jgi:vacuolar-type H+-ATPase subunit E/Vma4
MTLQSILEKIHASGDAQVLEIEKRIESQVNAILAQGRTEAHQIEEDACSEVSGPAVAERARILHRARLESLRIVGDVRENLVENLIIRTREKLATLRSDPSYPVVLRKLLKEALAELALGGAGKPQLVADLRDKDLLGTILDELKLDLPVTYELNCWGGLKATSEDGRVVVINTFESRLEHASAFLHRYLAALFEEESVTLKDVILV